MNSFVITRRAAGPPKSPVRPAESSWTKERVIAAIRQELLAATDAASEFVEADREFHRAFVAAAGNPILLGLHDSLRDRQSRMGLLAIAREQGRTEQIVTEHRQLLEAVLEADVESAPRIIDAHLGATLALLLPGSA